MRLWSIHPSYLDAKGMVAVWREGLLALAVLQGKTKGYRHHPQLARFKSVRDPVRSVSWYLHAIADEADRRGYAFNKEKLPPKRAVTKMMVTSGQLEYEFAHLLGKLKERDAKKYAQVKESAKRVSHPLFSVVKGEIESWEKV